VELESLIRRLRVATRRPRDVWERGLPHEVAWWEAWIAEDGRRWPEVYRERLDPTTELAEPLLVECIDAIPATTISILDVGAGPCTSLGKTYPGKLLEITPVDPLADEYNRLWAYKGTAPPVRTQACRGEELRSRFGPDRFDIAYARNALDHTADPALVIRNMLGVVRRGGFVVLRHSANEAVKADYRGLHQWNFGLRGGDLVVRRLRKTVNLSKLLRDEASVRAEHVRDEAGEWITALLVKQSGSAPTSHDAPDPPA
jgi:SAM-dependent methyltransferase